MNLFFIWKQFDVSSAAALTRVHAYSKRAECSLSVVANQALKLVRVPQETSWGFC